MGRARGGYGLSNRETCELREVEDGVEIIYRRPAAFTT